MGLRASGIEVLFMFVLRYFSPEFAASGVALQT
jgi:hypothetical protein